MPNKYEREIEEILRNLEHTEPKAGLGQRLGGRLRRRPQNRIHARKRSLPSLNFSTPEWFLIIAWIAGLIGGGWAYAHGRADTFTGIVALIGAVCLILLLLSTFTSRSRSSVRSTHYGNVTPLRRNPLNSLATRWHLFLLKLRYRRGRDK